MSTYRKRTQAKPTTAAGLRAQASASGNSIFRSRPRSLSGLYGGGHQSSYSNLLGGTYSTPSSPGYLTKSSPSVYKSPYSSSTGSLNAGNPYSTYGGTASGYGGLTLPSSLSPGSGSSGYGYLNGRTKVHRGGSFNKPKPKVDASGTFGSRSSSLQSLAGSEGYASGHDRSGRSSRLGSMSSLSSEGGTSLTRSKSLSGATSTAENGELDYKKLYEESQVENERLREKLRKSDEQLKDTQSQLEKAHNASQSKLALSETEKRERRAMERKLSEMEEELKQLQKLKAENERLKAENRALTRVVSKLTNTAK